MASKQGWTLGGIAAGLGLLGAAYSVWPAFGWMTPNGHAADLVAIEEDHETSGAEVLDAIRQLGLKIDNNQRQWVCDEKDEELLELLKQQEVRDTVEVRREIEKAKKFLDDHNCSDFEEVG